MCQFTFQFGDWALSPEAEDCDKPLKRQLPMKQPWLVSVIVLSLVAIASYGLYVQLRPGELPHQVIYGNGHIEGTEVRVSAEVNGRVVDNSLVEGQSVKAGDVLVRIDPTRFELERAKSKSEIAAIVEQKREAQRELATWQHHLQIALRDYQRYSRLSDRDVVSSQQLDQAENKLTEARGRVGVLEARIKAVTARLNAAEKSLRLIEMNLSKTKVVAPINGTVLVKAVEQGEYLPIGGTVGVVVNLSSVELKVFIAEKDIGKIQLGDKATIRVDAFPKRQFVGAVTRVDQKAQFTPREIHMPEERTRMVFGVTLAVENSNGVLKPGMPADAWILWQKEANWPERLVVPK